MSYSALTNQYWPSSQRSPRQGTAVMGCLEHHMASLNATAVKDMMVNRTRQVSSNYIITNEGEIWCIVDEEDRAWTSGSTSDGGRGAAWDRQTITKEIENLSTTGWTISPKAFEATAQLNADIMKRYGFRLERQKNHLGHRELYTLFRASYPTACPGGLQLDALTARSLELLTNDLPPNPTIPAQPLSTNTNYQFGLTAAAVEAIQAGLARLGRYRGDIDGIAGPMTVSALQQWLKDNRYLKADYFVDGIPGPIYGESLQRLAVRYGYRGDIDGYPAFYTSIALVKWANTLARAVAVKPVSNEGPDWSWWEPSGELAKRVQRALALRNDRFGGVERYSGPIDGVFGPNTRKGVQITLAQSGLHSGDVDGSMERDEAVGVQEYARRFGGYAGPIDGAPREMSWSGFAIGLERR